MNALRKVSVVMAVISLIYLLIGIWFGIDIPQEVKGIVDLVAAALVALGILTDTSADPAPLTKASILEKLKSASGIGALFALLAYIVYMRLAPEQADLVLQSVSTILMGIFGFNVYNSMNVRNAVR